MDGYLRLHVDSRGASAACTACGATLDMKASDDGYWVQSPCPRCRQAAAAVKVFASGR